MSRSWPRGNLGVDPLDGSGIWIKGGSEEDSLVGMIGIPVVSWHMLVIPDQLAGVRLQGHGRITVKLGWC